ncbi:MAG TPA: HipA domain-containing protein, partial [Opitutus sp.]|nr:HipA domain-containing protein [Opitutus sp.]
GSPTHNEADLRELWTRIVFNILVSNRDDHLRNHGFILADDGWRLAPAYDLNPNIERSHHLAIDSTDPTPDIALALATAEFYDLSAAQAGQILQHVRTAVGQWRSTATNHRLPRAEIEQVAQAFPPTSSAT